MNLKKGATNTMGDARDNDGDLRNGKRRRLYSESESAYISWTP